MSADSRWSVAGSTQWRPMNRFTRWWPNGTYCPAGREHVSWTTIETTAETVSAFGTEGPVEWCGCESPGWIAAPAPTPPQVAVGDEAMEAAGDG